MKISALVKQTKKASISVEKFLTDLDRNRKQHSHTSPGDNRLRNISYFKKNFNPV
jgi:hypothetical protein